jgi:hypothetical protein
LPRGKEGSRRPVSVRVAAWVSWTWVAASGTCWGLGDGMRSGTRGVREACLEWRGRLGWHVDGMWNPVTEAQLSVMRGRLGWTAFGWARLDRTNRSRSNTVIYIFATKSLLLKRVKVTQFHRFTFAVHLRAFTPCRAFTPHLLPTSLA